MLTVGQKIRKDSGEVGTVRRFLGDCMVEIVFSEECFVWDIVCLINEISLGNMRYV